MRQCIFLIGTRDQLAEVAPLLQRAAAQGMRHSAWFADQQQETIDDLLEDLALTSSVVRPDHRRYGLRTARSMTWVPATLYRFFHYVSGVKTWTGRRPLVVVHGGTVTSFLGALAGSWGGGDIVLLESEPGAEKRYRRFPEEFLRRLTYRRVRYALCPNDVVAKRLEQHWGCIVVNMRSESEAISPAAAVESLARWAS